MGYAIWTGTDLKIEIKQKVQSTLFRVLCAFLHLAPLLRGVILAGLVHCAHCGARMSGFIHRDRYKKKDGTVVENRKPKYNCFSAGSAAAGLRRAGPLPGRPGGRDRPTASSWT